MNMRLVPFSLSISVVSLLFFFISSVAIHIMEQQRIEATERAKASLERAREAEARLDSRSQEIDSLRTVLEAQKNERLLWLARAMYSETTKPKEMYYVGWVIRNRVEANYNDRSTYYGVILDPRQFSAFNRGNPRRDFYMNLDADFLDAPFHKSKNWFHALDVARRVLKADSSDRPFSPRTLYFYSEVSMPDYNPHPIWASKFSKVQVPEVKDERFRFLADIDEGEDASSTSSTSNNINIAK